MATRDQIIQKHADLARQEIEREEAKGQLERQLESLRADEEALGREYVALAKNASLNRPRMEAIGKRLKEVQTTISSTESQVSYQQSQGYQENEEQTARNERISRATLAQVGNKQPSGHPTHNGQGFNIAPENVVRL